MAGTSYKVVFVPKTYVAKTNVSKPGLDLERALIDFMLAKGLALNPSGDGCTLVPISGGGTGNTDLTFSRNSASVTIYSSSGIDVTLPAVTQTEAGVALPGDKIKSDFISITQSVNLDELELDVLDLTTLSGVPSNSGNLGTFPGSTITNSQTVKGALTELETAVETKNVKILFQNESVALGTTGTVDTIDFAGTNINAVRVGNKVTVTVTGSSGGGGTGLVDGDYGDVIVSGSGTVMTLDVSGVIAGNYGSVGSVPVIVVDAKGRVTSVTNTAILIGVGQIMNFDEEVQDTIGLIVDGTLIYNDNIPRLGRAVISGDVAIPYASNAATIQQNVVSNDKLADMNGNTVKLRSDSTTGDPTDFSLLPDKLLGRGSDNIAQIGLSSDFAIVADTLTFIGTSSGSSFSNYLTSVTNANVGSILNVFASAAVTAEWIAASNILEITIPSGVKLLYVDWKMVAADVQSTADASGATNWIQVKFIGTSGNTSITDLKIPNVQKTNLPFTGTLSVTNAGSIDIDNNPLITLVGVGSNTITLRVQGLAMGSQGYHLKFSNIS